MLPNRDWAAEAAMRRALAFIRVNTAALEDIGARLDDADAIIAELESALSASETPESAVTRASTAKDNHATINVDLVKGSAKHHPTCKCPVCRPTGKR